MGIGQTTRAARRRGRLARAKLRLRALRKKEKAARESLGETAYWLVNRGEPVHPEIAAGAERVRAARERVRAQEQEVDRIGAETAPSPQPPEPIVGPEPMDKAWAEMDSQSHIRG